MRRCSSLAWLLILVPPLLGAPPSLTLPEQVHGKPGQFIRVNAQTTGVNVSWASIDDGLALFPSELLKDSKTAVVVAAAAGSYRLLAVTAAGDELSPLVVCTVVVDGPTPPPGPPTPPIPNDPLLSVLQAAYTADGDSNKLTYLQSLQTLYSTAAQVTVNDVSLTTTAQLLSVLQKASASLLSANALAGVRQAIAGELNKTLSTPANLDAAKRAEIAKLFQRIAQLLGGLR